MKTELRTNLVGLFREAGQAHERLDMPFHKSQLIYCLMNADYEHQARSPDSDWAEFYADELLERCAPSDTPEEDKLALYHFTGCPFCSMVRANIERLGVEVELRDIFEDDHYRDELIDARGRATVPVLRITSPHGEERWLPESRDIVRYLEKVVG
jgi:glutaredoxin